MFKNSPYALAPKKILRSKEMSSDEKILYFDMLDLYKLSFINDWEDEYGIFIYYSIPSIEKSIGCSRPTAIKILNKLEKNGYITRKNQNGKPTKIYLTENEHTQSVLGSMKKYKKNKKHKKVAPKKVDKKDKQEEVTEINTFGVEVVEEIVTAEPKVQTVQTITDYTEKQSVFDVFKAIIGREPDRSFQKYITKRSMEMNITGENMRGIIEIARKARNPEAYIIAVIKSAQPSQQQTYQQEQQAPEPAKDAPLNEDEIDWLLDLEYYKKRNDEEYSQARIDELEQMLEVIKQKKAEEDAKRPLEDWEIDWLNEQKRYEQSCEDEQSQTIHQEVEYCLLE